MEGSGRGDKYMLGELEPSLQIQRRMRARY